MTSIARHVSPASLGPALAALAVCLAVAAWPGAVESAAAPGAAPGSDAPGTGRVTMTIGRGGKAAKALAAGGVKVRAIAPAKRRFRRVRLPVQSVAAGRAVTVALRGGIRFTTGRRVVKLRWLRVELTARRARITARAGSRRLGVFAARLSEGRARLDRSELTARLARAKLGMTARLARLLRAKLGIGDLSPGPLGLLRVAARPRQRAGGTPPGAGDRRGGAPAPAPGPGPGAPRSGPIESEPPVLARPGGAIDIAGASLTWRPRESWIQYINGGEGTSVFGGAVDGPPETRPGHSEQLVYSFAGFPFAGGWYHPPTGTAAVYFGGGVGFRWTAHGIDFSSASPEIEIDGASSRAIFTFDGTGNTRFEHRRGVLVNLHPGSIQTPAGGEVTYSDVPGTIPEDTGQSVFAGFYPANAPFGTLTLSFTTQAP